MNKPSILRKAWNCFRNYRKWRRAKYIGKACLALIGTKHEELAWKLYDINHELYAEIHGGKKL